MDTIKQKQTENQAEKRSTRQARIEGGMEGRKRKEEYLRIKKFALEREKENFSKLFIFKDNKGWWKMVGHSAVIFHNEIAKRIGMKTRLNEDTDFDVKSEDGVINIKSIVQLSEKLETVNVYLLELKEDYRVYNLGKKYDNSDLERLRKTQELEWGKVNKIILPKHLYPTLYKCERELLLNSYFAMKKVEAFARENFANDVMSRTAEMIRGYSLVMNEGTQAELEAYFKKCEVDVKWMRSQMAIFSELKLLELDAILRISYSIEKVLKEIRLCRTKKI